MTFSTHRTATPINPLLNASIDDRRMALPLFGPHGRRPPLHHGLLREAGSFIAVIHPSLDE